MSNYTGLLSENLVCALSGKKLPRTPAAEPKKRAVLALCLGEDKTSAVPILKEELLGLIPEQNLSRNRLSKVGGGYNPCHCRVVGQDEDETLAFDPYTDFWASISDQAVRRILPQVWARHVKYTSRFALSA
jgi:hypothetical protein